MMTEIVTLWHQITVEQLMITMLALGLGFIGNAYRAQQHQIRQLDKLLLLVCDRVARDAVKIHRSGDYEIVNPLNKE